MDPLDQQPHGNGNMTAAGDRASPGHPGSGEELERTGRSVSGGAVGGAAGFGALVLMRPPCPSPSELLYAGEGTIPCCAVLCGICSETSLLPPGFLGGCCETSGGRHRGTAVTSLTPCTPSASQQCSTSTWRQSPMPLPLEACWGMQLPTCRSVWPWGAWYQPYSAQPRVPTWVPTSCQHPQESEALPELCILPPSTDPAFFCAAGGTGPQPSSLLWAWHLAPLQLAPLPAFQGVLESFLGTAFAGFIFCLFSGQPLTILSSTGPMLVFERLLFSFSQ